MTSSTDPTTRLSSPLSSPSQTAQAGPTASPSAPPPASPSTPPPAQGLSEADARTATVSLAPLPGAVPVRWVAVGVMILAAAMAVCGLWFIEIYRDQLLSFVIRSVALLVALASALELRRTAMLMWHGQPLPKPRETIQFFRVGCAFALLYASMVIVSVVGHLSISLNDAAAIAVAVLALFAAIVSGLTVRVLRERS